MDLSRWIDPSLPKRHINKKEGTRMRAWIRNRLNNVAPDWLLPDCLIHADEPKFGPMHRKVLVGRGSFDSFDPNQVTWLGGICSLFTGDGEVLRRGELTFDTVDAFSRWVQSWYPRLDQVHDAMGIPPAACRRAIYVVEDSIWGRRVAKWTGLPAAGVTDVFRSVHREFGESIMIRWLKNFGYNGHVDVVYTSAIERELELALCLWERLTGKQFKKGLRDGAKVELMYTPLWLDILGLSQGVIAEPAHHIITWPCNLPNHGLFQIGYLPFWSAGGPTRLLPADRVAHRGNWSESRVMTGEQWTPVNLAFNCRDPFGFDAPTLEQRVSQDLRILYQGE